MAAAAAFLAAALAAQPATPAPADCTLKVVSRLDLEVTDSGLMTVPVTFNNKPFRMLVDTGAYFSVATDRVASDLGLEVQVSTGQYLVGFGGEVMNRYVKMNEFGFGSIKLEAERNFLLLTDPGEGFDGLFGADFLYNFDLDFDFAAAKLNMIWPEHCAGKVVYWTQQDYGVVPFDWNERRIQFTVNLDGKEVLALLDTGAPDTVMSLETAADLFKLDEKAVAKAKGRYPFKSLSFSSITVVNPAIRLVADKDSVLLGQRGPKMIVGMGVLRRLHLYIAYKEKKLYVTAATQR